MKRSMTQKILSWKFCAQKILAGWTKMCHTDRSLMSCYALFIFLHTMLQLQRQQETQFCLQKIRPINQCVWFSTFTEHAICLKESKFAKCVHEIIQPLSIGSYIKPMCDFQHLLSSQSVWRYQNLLNIIAWRRKSTHFNCQNLQTFDKCQPSGFPQQSACAYEGSD